MSAEALLWACVVASLGPGCSVKKADRGPTPSAPDPVAGRPVAVPTASAASADGAPFAGAQRPREIVSRSELELSGIAWAPTLGKYLVVSDDVVMPGADKHPPWIFALSPSGELDPSPIVIEGVPDLNDAESICAGPDGTFFLTTSHSRNLKGHLPPGRRRLLQIALAGKNSRVVGQVDLTEVRGTDGGLLDGPLDLEAITWRADGLYLGFKAPLVDGRATILRVADPAAQLAAGKIKPETVSLWARPRLCLESREGHPCQGVADMTFLPDGALLIVANAPKGMPKDGGGALWKLPGPDKSPAFLQWFEGYKPEGIALSPDRTAAVIVFDRDRKQPEWLRWPL